MLAVIASCSAPASVAGTGASYPNCSSAILALGQPGDRPIDQFRDGHGHVIELWCTSGVFTSQWDLRLASTGRTDAPHTAAAGALNAPDRGLTIGGCFFDNGTNTGPAIARDPDGAFARVAWTNRSAFGEPRTYRFSYDFHTGRVTITLTSACGAPVVKVVAPQQSYAKMDALLPHPSGSACP